MIKRKSPKQRFKFFYFLVFITCIGGTVVEKKNVMAKICIIGFCPDNFLFYRSNLNLH